jgi:hypothetical protein
LKLLTHDRDFDELFIGTERFRHDVTSPLQTERSGSPEAWVTPCIFRVFEKW